MPVTVTAGGKSYIAIDSADKEDTITVSYLITENNRELTKPISPVKKTYDNSVVWFIEITEALDVNSDGIIELNIEVK